MGLPIRSTPEPDNPYVLGYEDRKHPGFTSSCYWAANFLNDKYYRYRLGKLTSFEHLDGRLERPDPWQNAATVALQVYFLPCWIKINISPPLTAKVCKRPTRICLVTPGQTPPPTFPAACSSPPFDCPSCPEKPVLTPASAHRLGEAASRTPPSIFAPPNVVGGCSPTEEWAIAMADGTIVRTDTGGPSSTWMVTRMSAPAGSSFTCTFPPRPYRRLATALKAGESHWTTLLRWRHLDWHACAYRPQIQRRMGPRRQPRSLQHGRLDHKMEKSLPGIISAVRRTVIACDCSNQESLPVQSLGPLP